MTTPELAWAYFDTIKAPRKQFILVPGGHAPPAALLDRLHKLILEETRR